jgi:hypothetical protein
VGDSLSVTARRAVRGGLRRTNNFRAGTCREIGVERVGAGGGALETDVGDPRHHEVPPTGAPVRVTFPVLAPLPLPDE